MPSYVFECKKCQNIYEDLTPYDKTGKYKGVECPDCGSKSKNKLPTACSFQFANPIGTDKWNSDGTGHDYRYKYNQPNVRKEREMARKNSHMGTKPYGNYNDRKEGVQDKVDGVKLS